MSRKKELVEMSNKLYKNNPNDKISWVDNSGEIGVWLFTFDGKTIFNLFADYPHNLTPEQVKIFNKENPYWVEFFKDRQ